MLSERRSLEDFHFHHLRHEAVSRFVGAGLSDHEMSAISGHKSLQTFKRYIHLRAENFLQELERIAAEAAYEQTSKLEGQ